MAGSPASPDPRFRARIGDPMAGVGEPPLVLLPDHAGIFARRADRLMALADGHPMEAWLRFVADIARAQHAAVQTLDPPPPPAAGAGEPPLSGLALGAGWRAVLGALLRPPAGAPAETEAVCAALREAGAQAQEALAASYLRQEVPSEQAGAALFAAAALQLWYVRAAAALDAAGIALLAQRGRCPACGFGPVAGVVTAAGAAPGTRYLHCGLCATAWNHLRAACIGCGESGGLVLQQIEGGGEAAKAETCAHCQGYSKLFYQAKDMGVEPFADDLATLGLDLLVSEAGFARLSPSPLMIGG
ncbi:MAG: formate dehydrogenase accessory protein FdhE [Proteobacteria bacterium]|nr:formate dehydrogenase accessory protein FdhE [Pseudomonadota bacterium]